MAAIVGSIEIARRPEDVFAYATDSSRFPEWQASVVSVRQEGTGPLAVGSSAVVTRRLGRRTVPGTEEITALHPPRTWAWRAVGGLVRGQGPVKVEICTKCPSMLQAGLCPPTWVNAAI